MLHKKQHSQMHYSTYLRFVSLKNSFWDYEGKVKVELDRLFITTPTDFLLHLERIANPCKGVMLKVTIES